TTYPRAHQPLSLSSPQLTINYHSRARLKHQVTSLTTVATRPAKIGDKWRDYQGINDWEGLLDPLDDDLRREILRYGEFVEAAYRGFEFDSSSAAYATCRYPRSSFFTQCGLGGGGYRVTRNLRATCGVHLPNWIENFPSPTLTRTSWIGYVAVCNDKDEIARLGRRDVVIAYRGTATMLEWLENLRATGFLSVYTSSTGKCPSLRDMVREEIGRLLRSYGNEPLSVTIVGHSLGAALATITAYDITSTFDRAPPVTVFSFGGPRVGNGSFRCHVDRSGVKVLRIVNSDDFITKVPGFVVDNDDVTNKWTAHIAGLPSWLRKSVEGTRWMYADVGRELRLSSRESPYLTNGNITTSHDLKTYLHLINGFVSSTCPFRAAARRVLKRGQKLKR
ncbi:Phospholipase A(1), partial [Bertholletia excelsa]